MKQWDHERHPPLRPLGPSRRLAGRSLGDGPWDGPRDGQGRLRGAGAAVREHAHGRRLVREPGGLLQRHADGRLRAPGPVREGRLLRALRRRRSSSVGAALLALHVPGRLHDLAVVHARDGRRHDDLGVALAVLALVQEDVLAVVDQGPTGRVQEPQLLLEQRYLLLKLLAMPVHHVHVDLGHEQVLGLGLALHAEAAGDELLGGEVAAVVVVQELEDLLRVLHGELDRLQLVVDLRLVEGYDHLLRGERAAAVLVRVLEDLLQLAEDDLPLAVLPELRLPRIFIGGPEGRLNHDAGDDVQHAEARYGDEGDEEAHHAGLLLGDVAHDVLTPSVKGHDLEQAEHGAPDRLEVDLVVPAAGGQEVGVVELVVVADGACGDDRADLDDEEEEATDPNQRLHGVDEAAGHEPELLEHPQEPDEPDEAHEPHEAQHRDKPGSAAHANGHEDEGVKDRCHNDNEVKYVPGIKPDERPKVPEVPLAEPSHGLPVALT
mmetsp:Transcript_79156/g.245693  ORF Transcript_79156/g.245693 Transcript_79156/m.245693 type:complete len:491 (+) Transcript_79156:41-1513(+)